MYGLVNKGVEELVRRTHGDEMWEQVKARAGVDVEFFVRMDAYPDDVTYRLVGAASEISGMPAHEMLEAFGEHWTTYTATEGYGDLMTMAGETLVDFLMNLDRLHSHVGLSFQHLRPPSFTCTDVTPRSLQLHYYSQRAGLAPMVVGLLKGLAVRFATPITVELIRSREAGDDHEVFLITFEGAS
ncbi:MAG: hypothetical protein RLZZ387_3621 [Chloroflexota bacterium]|jgi:hypothetical protein